MKKKIEDDMSDDKIRILGADISQEDTYIKNTNKHRRRWLGVIVCIFTILAFSLLFFFLNKSNDDSVEQKDDTNTALSQHSVKEDNSSASAYAEYHDTIINDIPMRVISPTGGRMELHMGKVSSNDKTIVLAAMAADIRADENIPTGAFVHNGELISKGHSKYGFCAIFGDEVIIGRQRETPLFERAIEENGSFFRQYSLVSDGKLMDIPPKGKASRRALCLTNGKFIIIETIDKESYHDFSQALIDYGVKEALALVGGEGRIIWQLDNGEMKEEGTSFEENINTENYIIWRKSRK